MINIENILEQLKINGCKEILIPYWSESLKTFNANSNKILKSDDLLDEIATFCSLTEEDIFKLEQSSKIINKSKELSFLFHHIYQLIFKRDDFDKKNYKNLPNLGNFNKELFGSFYILLILELFRNIRQYHQDKNISDTISKETLFDLKINMNRYARGHNGEFGITTGVLGWFKSHSSRMLYKIGRLQFLPKHMGNSIKVFRNDKSNNVVALSKENITFTKEGFWPVAGKEDQLETNWTSILNETENSIDGYPISPKGYALQQLVSLDKNEWINVLKEGDEVLDIHIPEGGKMTVETCISSMKDAVIFYKKYFPNKSIKAFTCRSWIFASQYEEIYRPDANFVKFQKEVFLFPVWSSGKEGVYFIFDTEDIDLDTIETKSSLQKAMVSHLKDGRVLRAGGMFFLCDDIKELGNQRYRGRI